MPPSTSSSLPSTPLASTSSPSSSSLRELVQSLVPDARHDARLRERLISFLRNALTAGPSRANDRDREADIPHLTELVKRHLVLNSPSGSAATLRFTNLLSKLVDLPILTRKAAAIQFMHSLAVQSSSSSLPSTSSTTPTTTSRPLSLLSLDPVNRYPSALGARRMPSRSPTDPTAASSHAYSLRRVSSVTLANGMPPPSISNPQSVGDGARDRDRDRERDKDRDRDRDRGPKTKAEILRRWRAKMGKTMLPEEELLRDALFILQGISGKHVKLVDDGQKADAKLVFDENSQNIISMPNRALIHRLAELGHLYTRVSRFIRERTGAPGVGMIEQSLCHYLESHLTDYYRLIAVLESQMHLSSSTSDSADSNTQTDSGLTLKRLEVWIDDWRLRLRMMSSCVEGCRDVSGGALVNLIHSYTENGDPFVRKVTDELLGEVSRPFFSMLQKWLFSGELYDPFEEFFVSVNPDLKDVQFVQRVGDVTSVAGGGLGEDGGFGVADEDYSREYQGGLKLWESKYIFRKEMLPAFVSEDFGRKIFATGKSLNFIRYSCQDSDWIVTREKLGTTNGTLQYSDISGLERSIDSAYSIASQRLFDVFFEKFGLLVHFKALKNYLLLGHGDFSDSLMDQLGPNLSRPANTLYRHNLTAKLEEAIRSTNAQNDPPDVLRRLDARMLEYTHGEIGWDVFTLEYKVDAPIDTVLDGETMLRYLRLFSHLWKMKRVEGALTTGWMRVAGGSRTFLRVPELEIEWHQVRLAMSEMIHFVRQVQAYCHLEVIECQWQKLLDFIHKKEGGLDGLISAHKDYVTAVDKKALLWYPKSGKEDTLLRQLRDLFDTILQFRTSMDEFYNYTLAEHARQESERDIQRGIYSDPRLQRDFAKARESLPRILQRTREYAETFHERVSVLCSLLYVHPDLDCKDLSIRLSFSEFYKLRKEKEVK